MIPEELEKKLERLFKAIKFNKSKDGNLAINEWDFTDDEPSFKDLVNVEEVTFVVNAIFERNKFKKLKKGFISDMSQGFVIMERSTAKAGNKRVKLVLKLKQAVSSC